MTQNYREYLIEGLLERLGRYARAEWSQRVFLVYQLTQVLSTKLDS